METMKYRIRMDDLIERESAFLLLKSLELWCENPEQTAALYQALDTLFYIEPKISGTGEVIAEHDRLEPSIDIKGGNNGNL